MPHPARLDPAPIVWLTFRHPARTVQPPLPHHAATIRRVLRHRAETTRRAAHVPGETGRIALSEWPEPCSRMRFLQKENARRLRKARIGLGRAGVSNRALRSLGHAGSPDGGLLPPPRSSRRSSWYGGSIALRSTGTRFESRSRYENRPNGALLGRRMRRVNRTSPETRFREPARAARLRIPPIPYRRA